MTRLLMDVVEAFPRLHAGTFTLQEFFSAGDADGDQRRRRAIIRIFNEANFTFILQIFAVTGPQRGRW